MAERQARRDDDVLVTMLSVTLDRAAGRPLVRQLYRHIRDLILSQRLAAGARLPSTRQLSRDLDVSRTVTLEAFGQLAAEGFLETRPGAGHFVAHLNLAPASAAHAVHDSPAAAGEGLFGRETGIPFDPGWQAVGTFPAQTWGRMLGRGWRRHESEAMERHWAGLPALRAALAGHLHALRGVPLAPRNVFVTSGNVDALTLIARSLKSKSKAPARAWIEDPGSSGSSSAAETC